LTILSSRSAQEDFCAQFPEYAHKARLSSFPSLLAFAGPAGEPSQTVQKFNLPDKFVLIANQFWRHKNHHVVIEAIGRLRQKGVRVNAVITGLPLDYRDPNNEPTSRILQAIATAGAASQIVVLGLVSESDYVNLMQASAAVVQPSLFEGWSTVIQDAKALGRPLICSDIPVHREQAPGALGFFSCEDAGELADILAENWPELPPGPDAPREQIALRQEFDFARRHGQQLLEICREAVSMGN
jgi:glycosyltransferase involved in cell wall biosynthesis